MHLHYGPLLCSHPLLWVVGSFAQEGSALLEAEWDQHLVPQILLPMGQGVLDHHLELLIESAGARHGGVFGVFEAHGQQEIWEDSRQRDSMASA